MCGTYVWTGCCGPICIRCRHTKLQGERNNLYTILYMVVVIRDAFPVLYSIKRLSNEVRGLSNEVSGEDPVDSPPEVVVDVPWIWATSSTCDTSR